MTSPRSAPPAPPPAPPPPLPLLLGFGGREMELGGLLLLGAALGSCRGSWLHLQSAKVFPGDARAAFGTSLVAFGDSADGGLLVGAPLEQQSQNCSGGIYLCSFRRGNCQKVPLTGPPGAVNASLGLSLAAGEGGVLACGPRSSQHCGLNVHLKGFCVQLDSSLRPVRNLPETFPECPKRSLDIAFLMDGSGSIADHDFQTMKVFISEVIRRFRGADAQFSLTQFSHTVQDHFDFRTFRNSPDIAELLRNVRQLGSTTRTATAIRTVLRNMFRPGRGARPAADRVLIVVTDGEKFGDDLEYSDVIPEAEAMAVTRYAIGVGGAFSTRQAQAELRSIASAPAADHVFRVDNFDALQGIQGQLHEKIFAIEGTSSAHSSSFQLEMSQEGFSAAVTPSGPLLGAVGVSDWAGGALLFGRTGQVTLLNGSGDLGDIAGDMRDSYLGYSLLSLSLGRSPALALGAPRFRHLGLVVLVAPRGHLGSPGHTWRLLAKVVGPQVGSYFGATLLALQPQPGDSPAAGGRGSGGRGSGGRGSGGRGSGGSPGQVLLVGAPNYHGEGRGGRVEICQLGEQAPHLRCGRALRGSPGQPQGRFGASLAHLGDLDGDTWPEVAVGAPLEDDGIGAVYLFRGERGGVSAQDGQRISGSSFPSPLRFFGHALSGGRDLSGDHLPDLAVGTWGQVLLLRSPPQLAVSAQVSFQPQVIPAATWECREEQRAEQVGAELCFLGERRTRDKFGSQISLSLWFRAELDPGRTKFRGIFVTSGSQNLNGSIRVGEGRSCQELRIGFKECPGDSLTPLALRVTFGGQGEPLRGGEGLRAQLSRDSQTSVTAALPFEHNCGDDNFCQDDLSVEFNFSGSPRLLVGAEDSLQVTLQVTNLGENSFGTLVTLGHPGELSYRKVTILESPWRSTSLRCHSEPPRGQERRTVCEVNHPVMRRGQVVFQVTLDVPANAELGDIMEVTAEVTSDNGGPAGRGQQVKLPVTYQVLLVLSSGSDSTRYLNVTKGLAPPAVLVTHHYQVQLLGHRAVPTNVTFAVPFSSGGEKIWEVIGVTPGQDLPPCLEGPEPPEEPPGAAPERRLLECPGSRCRKFSCPIPKSQPPKIWNFRVLGKLRLSWLGQPKAVLLSSAQLDFDLRKFQNTWGRSELQVQTELELLEIPNSLPLILGSSLGGLLLLALLALGLRRLGFFRRRYKEKLQEEGEENSQNSQISPQNSGNPEGEGAAAPPPP